MLQVCFCPELNVDERCMLVIGECRMYTQKILFIVYYYMEYKYKNDKIVNY